MAAVHGALETELDSRAFYCESAHVRETFEGELVWEGEVHVFDLAGHSDAKTAYGWSDPIRGLDQRRYYEE